MKSKSKYSFLLAATIGVAANPVAWRGELVRADEPADWCGTHTHWVAQVGNDRAVASESCPTYGDCDTASVRDLSIPDESTPIP